MKLFYARDFRALMVKYGRLDFLADVAAANGAYAHTGSGNGNGNGTAGGNGAAIGPIRASRRIGDPPRRRRGDPARLGDGGQAAWPSSAPSSPPTTTAATRSSSASSRARSSSWPT